MIVIPAIDVRKGRVVRLTRGRADAETVYAEDPAEVAADFQVAGAPWLHVVDLDAALGTGANHQVLRRVMAAVSVPLQVGGGLRSIDAVAQVLSTGATRVVLGTGAVGNPAFLRDAVDSFGDRVAVALDTDGERILVKGWTARAGRVEDVLEGLNEAGVARYLVTAVSRDGTLQGPDVDLYRRITGLTDRPVIASGGVRSVADLEALAALGLEGAVVGKALYEGSLTLEDALAVLG